jgi:plastocyanin domain-containing protein
MQQKLIAGITIAVALILVALIISPGTKNELPKNSPSNGTPDVRMEGGTQIIHIFARGGYRPGVVNAQSGVPTRLEIETNGTYDCSAALVIPALQYKKMLPPTGTTLIDIPQGSPGSTLTALCAMGMYSFRVQFN